LARQCGIRGADQRVAEGYLNTALDFYRQTEMRPYRVRTLFTLAQLFTQQNRLANAHNARIEAETLLTALTSEGT